MYLVRLIYKSKVREGFDPKDIETILNKARVNNAKKNVTGLLCFNKKHFLQCLEGSRKVVNDVYHKILNDERHSDIILLNYSEIEEREFDEWSMAYMPQSSLTSPLNLKYSGTPNVDPYEISGESAYRLICALKKIC